jgi:hypothetical protein
VFAAIAIRGFNSERHIRDRSIADLQHATDAHLTETDGPLARWRARRAIPPDVIYGLGELWKIGPDEAANEVFANFRSAIAADTTPAI